LFKGEIETLLYLEKMLADKPIRCQKCGKPLGYVTVLGRGLTGFQQPVPNVKIVFICMDCVQKK